MRRASITIDVEVPEWADFIAVDGDGRPVAMHPHRNDTDVGIHTDDESESWYAGMCKPLRVTNWRETCQTVRPAIAPCAECGGNPAFERSHAPSEGLFYGQCDECGNQAACEEHLQDAVARWNVEQDVARAAANDKVEWTQKDSKGENE